MFTHSALVNEMKSLRKFALKLTHNAQDADDLLQSTVLRALEKKHLFHKETSLFKWSSKIMYNIFVSNYRRKVKFETQCDPESFIERESVGASQDKTVELMEIGEAMGKISHDHREILMLVCVRGMQYAEVSEALQIPIGTVRSRLSRARESLTSELGRSRATSVRQAMPVVPAYMKPAAEPMRMAV